MITVWASELVIFSVTHGHTGEQWGQYSPLELCGLFLLIVGIVLFTDKMNFPFPWKWCEDYADTPNETADFERESNDVSSNT